MVVAVHALTFAPAHVSGIFGASARSRKAAWKLPVQNSVRHAITRRSRTLKLGDPMRTDTEIDPIATRPQIEKVRLYIDPATSEGALCFTGLRQVRLGRRPILPTFSIGIASSLDGNIQERGSTVQRGCNWTRHRP
ncbi:aldehyde dehydrogenase family protein [Paraburkholderia hospita]|uniref:aldehyde dehydrogenase family protein n=1 Tax=Paraburkholderia hospita TaxID=169430 RepID=UPI000DEF85FB